MPKAGSSPKGYRFSVFEVDLLAREIRKNGRKVKLQDQPFRVLALLLENYPNLVAREDLRKLLWDEDTFVEFDHGLTNAISRIREALGDSAENARFVETLPKRGYRFVAPIETIDTVTLPLSRTNGNGQNGTPSVTGKRETTLPRTIEGIIPQAAAKASDTPARRNWPQIAVFVAVVIALGLVLAARVLLRPAPVAVAYTQLTNFADEAFAPALSPDGRMVAFIRGSDTAFPFQGEIYAKLLPNGEPMQLTHDGWPKYGVSFSPDGTQITYTTTDLTHTWTTTAISALGGEPRILLVNAAGLTWLDANHVLFGEIKTGLHMGLMTSTENRSEVRDVYLPQHERGMAHYGAPSPDRKWVLVVEMGGTGGWERCRLVPFAGGSLGSQVGPAAPCTSAAWSPDGKAMYFTGGVGSNHIWRQPFPDGEIEQVTSGPTDERGIAISGDGRSLITSIGIRESGLWMHDQQGEHLLSFEGYALWPTFSRDGRLLYYIRRESPESAGELWAINMSSRKSQPIVQGFSIASYSVSPDGPQIVFQALAPNGASQIWLASSDRKSEPRMLASSGEDSPGFGPDGEIVFRASENGKNYLYKMGADGSGRSKVLSSPVENLLGMSPDGLWAISIISVNGDVHPTAMFAVPIQGGAPKRICPAACVARWSPDGARFFVKPWLETIQKAVVIPVPRGKSLPDLPVTGIRTVADAAALPGATMIDLSNLDPSVQSGNFAPGLAPIAFAYARTVVHRNLFQVPLH
jgi:DNA-binding winged helix-turn-helix (wHTH) protein/Tol biopolymer transport system component